MEQTNPIPSPSVAPSSPPTPPSAPEQPFVPEKAPPTPPEAVKPPVESTKIQKNTIILLVLAVVVGLIAEWPGFGSEDVVGLILGLVMDALVGAVIAGIVILAIKKKEQFLKYFAIIFLVVGVLSLLLNFV